MLQRRKIVEEFLEMLADSAEVHSLNLGEVMIMVALASVVGLVIG